MEELAAWQRAMRLAQELHTEPLVDVSAKGMRERRASMRLAQPQAWANLAGTWLLDPGASHHMVYKSCMSGSELEQMHQGPPISLATASGRITHTGRSLQPLGCLDHGSGASAWSSPAWGA